MDTKDHKTGVAPIIFSTKRLTVRALTLDDLHGFHDMQGNPRVMQHVGGRAFTLEENHKDLQDVIEAYGRADNDFWVWAVVRKTDGAFAGTCALIVNDRGEDEIGYRFREKYWGMGYGREICRSLLQYGFEAMHKTAIVAYVDKANRASVRILEQTMTFEKEFYNEEEGCVDRKYLATSSK